jgi:Peptidase family M28
MIPSPSFRPCVVLQSQLCQEPAVESFQIVPWFGQRPRIAPVGGSATAVLPFATMRYKSLRHVALAFALLASLTLTAGAYQSTSEALTPDVRAALDRISADSLRNHLSFIASDLLEGRDTPSRGLDLAAEYIAAQFRRAGLEAAGDDGYFQTANFVLSEFNAPGFQLTFQSGTKEVHAAANQVTFATPRQNWVIAPTAVIKLNLADAAALGALTPDQVQGKVMMMELPTGAAAQAVASRLLTQLQALRPAVLVMINREIQTGSGSELVDPENRNTPTVALTLHAPEAIALYDALPSGLTAATFSLRTAVTDRPAKLRNVIGVLRGSDPVLRNTYVLVTAHYDHIGVNPSIDGDKIYNGANDDGSGTVSVVEIASALTTLQQRPKRSIIFMTVFGEEKGMLGSRYYTRHPIFPLEQTIANINLEQVGRTDSTEGPQVGTASLTGFDFSDLGTILQTAGESTGIRVYKHPTNSDAYFSASDNQAFASMGIPAHSLCVAFNYPDYHRPGDHWDKVDYENMAKVDRMVALALVTIATNPEVPKWNEANPRTGSYVRAWRARHPGQ